MKNNSLIKYDGSGKYTTAIEALKAPVPQISKIKREAGEVTLKVNIAAILERLFTARYSKHQLSTMLCDEFSSWLLTNYYFLKLPEIELALMDYRGETFQVIDLEALKTMIETYDMKRCQATLEAKPKPDSEVSETAIPIPKETKKLTDRYLLDMATGAKRSLRRPETLLELFAIQKRKDPETDANNLISEINNDYDKMVAYSEKNNVKHLLQDRETYVKNQVNSIIRKSGVRVYGEVEIDTSSVDNAVVYFAHKLKSK